MRKIIIGLLLIILAVTVFTSRVRIKYWFEDLIKQPLPQPKSAQEFFNGSDDQARVIPGALTLSEAKQFPHEFNLDVPFTSQAPLAEWDEVHEEACEEASVLMVHYYFQDKGFAGPEEADAEILKFIDFEKEFLGFFESTTADELARTVEAYWDYDVDLIYDFSVENIKHAILQGYPVVVPAAGRILDNPHFQDPGPVYHMLVIKGWIGDEFITNDPGTKHGHDWLYTYDHLLDSAHDWNGGEVEQGRKVILIIKK